MYGTRICLVATLVVSTISAEAAEDYVVPTGVSVLTEDQLLNQIIGSTLSTRGWSNYFLPPSGDQKKGRFKGRFSYYGSANGDWTVNGSLMCRYFDAPAMVAFNVCATTNLDGDTVTWYLATGTPWYSRAGQIKLIAGNPENF